MEVINLALAYRISISTVVSPDSCFNVLVTYEQARSTVVVSVLESEYVITYKHAYVSLDDKKMFIHKDDCDTDRLFQLCTVHPFSMDDLQKMLVDCSKIDKLLKSV